MKFLLRVSLLVILASSLYAQSECFISIANEPQKQTHYRTPLQLAQIGSGEAWIGTSIQLSPGAESSILYLDNIQALVPVGSVITGIEVRMAGASTGPLVESNVSLANEGGVVSENKAGTLLNSPYGIGQQVWKYGGRLDNWNGDLSPDLVNTQDFGIQYQVRNTTQEVVQLDLTSIHVNITYHELYTVCPEHVCVIFYIPDASQYTSFDWHTPEGFVNLDNDPSDGIYSLGVSDAEHGYYDVCLDLQSNNGPEQCCRTFRLSDCNPGALGDLVWEDQNQNGVQDNGELGLAGVEVLLFDDNGNLVGSQITSGSGSYLFNDLEPSAYRVVINGLDDYFPSYASALSDLYAGLSSDLIFVDYNAAITTVDLGLYKAYELAGVLWHDQNCDGIYAETGSGISDLLVTLYDEFDTPIASVLSEPDGAFDFGLIPTGNYAIGVDGFDPLLFTPTLFVDNDPLGNTLLDVNGQALTSAIQLNQNTNMYLGLKTIVHQIDGLVWLDENCNGYLDNENGFPELVVSLINSQGETVQTTSVGFDGSYAFEPVTYGDYSIELSGFDDQIFAPTIQPVPNGIYNTLVSLNNGATGTLPFFVQDDQEIHLGLKRISYDIAGQVWLDQNCDGVLNDPDSNFESLLVSVVNTNGTAIQSTFTSVNGSFEFSNIPVGQYTIALSDFDPNFFEPTIIPQNGGVLTNALLPSTTSTANTETFDLNQNTEINLGLKQIVHQLTGDVWQDTNCDGLINDGLQVIEGLSVTLLNSSGDIVGSSEVNSAGEYSFDNISFGQYSVVLNGVDPLFYEPTLFVGGGGNILSQISNAIIGTGQILIDSDKEILLGIKPIQYKVSGKAWIDLNCDGFYSPGEIPIDQLQVNLLSSAGGSIASAMIDEDGAYCFTNIWYGDYAIEVTGFDQNLITPTITPPAAGLDIPNSLTLFPNGVASTPLFTVDENTGVYLGFKQITHPVQGFVWEDLNCDGMYSENEPILEGINLSLVNPQNTTIGSVVSTGSGFDFGAQIVDDYTVEIIGLDPSYTATFNPPFEEGNSLNQIDNQLVSDTFFLTENTYLNFGVKKTTAQISGITWFDLDGDGIRSIDDTLFNDMVVRLFDCEGTPIDGVTSNENGEYTFDDVSQGEYYVVFVSNGDIVATQNLEIPNELNSDITGANGVGSTSCFLVEAGEIYAFDGGFTQLGLIGDFVWADIDADGLQEDEELGIPGLLVELYDVEGIFIDETFTDSNGGYAFSEVWPGEYYVRIVIDETIQFTSMTTTNSDMDSDISNQFGFGTSSMFTILAGEADTSIDAGVLLQLSSISGAIWEDESANNGRDSGDLGLFDFVISLLNSNDEIIATTTSDVDGNYSFTGLFPGDYRVRFFVEEQFDFVEPNFGNASFDSDVIDQEGYTAVLSLGINDNLVDIDAGVFAPGTIQGSLYIDVNANNIQDEEDMLALNKGVNVLLIDAGTQEVVESTVASEGQYEFLNIMPGFYIVRVDLIDNHIFSAFGEGFNEDIDFNVFSINDDFGETNSILITSSEFLDNVDIGYIPDVEFGKVVGTVFVDNYANGIQDADDGMFEVPVRLYSVGGVHINATMTDQQGDYVFDNVIRGEYYVEFEIPELYFVTENEVSNDETIDSDFFEMGGNIARSELISLTDDGQVLDVDGGVYQMASLEGVVWYDANENGIREASEDLIDGYEVTLGRGFGDNIATSTTVNGKFSFEDIKPGLHHLLVNLDDTYAFTLADVGNDDSVDNDIANQYIDFGTTFNLFVRSGEAMQAVDVGLRERESLEISEITGKVFEDQNANGINENDPGIAAFDVTLIDFSNGVTVAQTTTNSDGEFIFPEVLEGEYVIHMAPGSNWILTEQDAIANEALDSDFEAAPNSVFYMLQIENIASTHEVTAGFYRYASLGDLVWEDVNSNGIQDVDEVGLPNITISIYNGSTLIGTQTTDQFGFYTFDNLLPGGYRLVAELAAEYQFSEANLTDEALDSDIILVSGSSGSTALTTLRSGDNNTDLDVGMFKNVIVVEPALIRGAVWEDLNANGLFEIGEPRINDVTVSLYNESGQLVASLITGEQGIEGVYQFEVESFGQHFIVFEGEAIADQISTPYQGSNGALDSDVTQSQSEYSTDLFNIAEGQSIEGINYGVFNFAMIGDYAWLDANSDGIQQFDEEGINGIRIQLFNQEGEFIAQKFTLNDQGGSGYYLFDNLMPDYYYIEVTLNAGLEFTQGKMGLDDDFDSDILDGTNRSEVFGLHSSEENLSIDVGFATVPGQVGDYVWIDTDGDGVQSDDEEGLNGVVVDLYSESGVLQASTMTSSKDGEPGYYIFDNVFTGNYYIKFTPLDDYLFVRANSGNNDGLDSDVASGLGYGTTDIFSLESGISDLDIDAGVFLPSVLGNFVWEDSNQNGIQDIGEDGFAGAEIALHHTEFGMLRTVISDISGFYSFDDLPAGEYYMDVSLPAEIQFTQQNMGADPTKDSNVSLTGLSDVFSIEYNTLDYSMDIGVYRSSGFVGDFVWHDINGNGQQDLNEPGLPDVELMLVTSSMIPMNTTVTDEIGGYTFADLTTGDYRVQVTIPEGFEMTDKDAGFLSEEDSDFDGSGLSDVLFINANNSRNDIDAGLYMPGQIVTSIWIDHNEDGIMNDVQDDSISGEVELVNANGETVERLPIASSNGIKNCVELESIKPGEYLLRYHLEEDWKATERNFASDPMLDSDISTVGSVFETESFIIHSGQYRADLSAGIILSPIERRTARIYPNPLVDNLNIEIDSPELSSDILAYKLFDQNGKLVKNASLPNANMHTIQVKDLLSGVYQLYIEIGPERIEQQIIKID